MEATALVGFAIAAILLGHGYVLYPLLALLRGPTKSPTRTSTESYLPSVSMLVPAYNESAEIEKKIQNFHQIDYPQDRIELIIADDNSADGTAELIRPHVGDRVRLIESTQRNGKATNLKRMAEAARFDLLFITDANVMLAPSALRRLVEVLADESVGAVTGVVKLVGSARDFEAGESFYYLLETRIQQAESSWDSVMGVDGGMYAIHKRLFPMTLPSDTILDDMHVSIHVMQQGKRVCYDPKAKALESGTPSLGAEFSRRARIAAGAVQLLRRGQVPPLNRPVLWLQFMSHKLIRWASPILLVILLVSSLFLATQHSLFLAASVAQITGYGVALVMAAFPAVRQTKLGAIVVYFTMSQVATMLGLVRGALNLQSVRWNRPVRQASELLP